MGMRLLLIASIVSGGLVFVQPRNDVGNDPHEVRENFRNLFNSINKNDVRKTGTYRNALELEAARERQNFDTMKETWRSRRQRNADEHRDIRERRAAFKREAETTAFSRNADRVLYKKLKENPGYFSNMNLVEGVRTRLNEENEGLELMLYDYGYLSIKPTTQEPDGHCILYFPSFDAEMDLMRDLIYGAELEDSVCRDTLSIIRESFKQEPPTTDGFAFIMNGIGTIIRQLPYVKFPDNMFYRLAVLGTLRCSGLAAKFGDTPVDGGIIFDDNLTNITRLVLEMQFERGDAQKSWNSDFEKRLRVMAHHRRPRKKLLACVMKLSGEQNDPVRDWYGQYLYHDPDGNFTIYGEYKNPESGGSQRLAGSADTNMYEQLTGK